jgi:hypothetical protein
MAKWTALLHATLVATALVALLPAVQAKRVTGRVQLTAGDEHTGPEYEVTKYSFLVGTGLVRGKFTYRNPHTWMTSPALYLFMDEEWDTYRNALTCDDKVAVAHASIAIGTVTRSHKEVLHKGVGKANKADTVNRENGMVEFAFEWEVETKQRSRGWFLVVADCALEQFNAHVPPMVYDIEILNPGLTHLPVSIEYMTSVWMATTGSSEWQNSPRLLNRAAPCCYNMIDLL